MTSAMFNEKELAVFHDVASQYSAWKSLSACCKGAVVVVVVSFQLHCRYVESELFVEQFWALDRFIVHGQRTDVLAIVQADTEALRVVRVSPRQRTLSAVEVRGADEAG
jgi:hypothetical protein